MSSLLDEEDLLLLPSDNDVAFYRRHGWYQSKKIFSDHEIDMLVEASEAFYDAGPDRNLPHHPTNLAYWRKADGNVQRHHDYIAYENRVIGNILTKPLLGAVAARLAISPAIRLFQSTLIYKPAIAAEASNLVPWHFDKHYWSTCSSTKMLTAFIPMHDCSEENGTLVVVDGSHQWNALPATGNVHQHFAKRDPAELDEMLSANAQFNGVAVNKVPMNLKKGHVSFHHCKIYHGSGANMAAVPRRAISLHLQPADNHWVNFVDADGVQQSYNHDAMVRKTSDGYPDYQDPQFCPVIWAQ